MIIEKFKQAGIDISPELEEKFKIMADFLVEYNKKVNLTAITDYEEIIEKHFIDSVLPLTMVKLPEGTKCVDIGTGAGFPSLPMMLLRPDLNFTLVDSLQKRVVYLREVCKLLNLSPEIIHSRAEDLGRDVMYREKYGMATARAVSGLPELAEYCLPLLQKGGLFIAMRGSRKETDNKLNSAFKLLGGNLKEEIEYALPLGDKRRLVIAEKNGITPAKFPRNSGQIKSKNICEMIK